MGKNFTTCAVTAALLLTLAAVNVQSQNLSARYEGRGGKVVTRSQEESTQTMYRLSASKDIVMHLNGTTPVRDWKMSAHVLTGDAVLQLSKSGTLTDVQSLTFTLPVHNLKADVRAMEEDAYEALKADRHKEIVFRLIDAQVSAVNTSAITTAQYRVEARGTLTVAGVTRPVTLNMSARIDREGAITFTGSQELKMSDYDVERPSLLFGAIKAGNEMTLTYKLIFKRA